MCCRLFVDVVTERLKIRRAAKQEAKRRAEEAKQEAESASMNPAEEKAQPSSELEKAEGSESMGDGSSQGNVGVSQHVFPLNLLVFFHSRGLELLQNYQDSLFFANGHPDSLDALGPLCCSSAASVQPAAGDNPASTAQDPPAPKADSLDSKHNEAQAADCETQESGEVKQGRTGTAGPAPEPPSPPCTSSHHPSGYR